MKKILLITSLIISIACCTPNQTTNILETEITDINTVEPPQPTEESNKKSPSNSPTFDYSTITPSPKASIESAIEITHTMNSPLVNLGTDENPIIWAIVSNSNKEETTSSFQSIANIIYKQTGLVIEPYFDINLSGVVEAMAADPPRAHIATLPAFVYIIASGYGIAEAELVSLKEGKASQNGQIFVRADSGITSIPDLAGKTFCGPDPLSISGWIIPMITLAANGINPDTDLRGAVFAGHHDAAVLAVYKGECDSGSSYVDAREIIAKKYPDIMDAVSVIEITVDVPNNGIQYHPSVPRQLRDLLNGVILSMHEIKEGADALYHVFMLNELVLRDDSFYEPLRQLIDSANFNMEQFLGKDY